jgi:hypothetical protein
MYELRRKRIIVEDRGWVVLVSVVGRINSFSNPFFRSASVATEPYLDVHTEERRGAISSKNVHVSIRVDNRVGIVEINLLKGIETFGGGRFERPTPCAPKTVSGLARKCPIFSGF